MKEHVGRSYFVSAENPAIAGCTVSKEIFGSDAGHAVYFSLAADTDISPETYAVWKAVIVHSGILKTVNLAGEEYTRYLKPLQAMLITPDTAFGTAAPDLDCIYTEITFRRNMEMNKMIQPGEVLDLAKILPVSEGKIINMDVLTNAVSKFVLMSFDAGCALSEHAAPGEAMIFALEGEAIITYEGRETSLTEGMSFCFAKGGLHAVKAVTPFKMALLIML